MRHGSEVHHGSITTPPSPPRASASEPSCGVPHPVLPKSKDCRRVPLLDGHGQCLHCWRECCFCSRARGPLHAILVMLSSSSRLFVFALDSTVLRTRLQTSIGLIQRTFRVLALRRTGGLAMHHLQHLLMPCRNVGSDALDYDTRLNSQGACLHGGLLAVGVR